MSEAATGRRILGEIEETSLDEVLTTFRASLSNATSFLKQSTSAEGQATRTSNQHSALTAPPSSKVKSYPIQVLDALVTRHFRATQSAPLSLSGTYLPLIYKLVATLIASPHNKAVVIIDIDAKFDITRVLQTAPYSTSAKDPTVSDPASPSSATSGDVLLHQQSKEPAVSSLGPYRDRNPPTHGLRVAVEDLRHVHVYRPARGSPSHVRDVLTSAEHFIIYSRHASIAREWWGTVVIGGGSPTALGPEHADVTTGWKGWLRVDREEVRGFPLGVSAEEALDERDQRQRAVDASGYAATGAWGGFNFREADGE